MHAQKHLLLLLICHRHRRQPSVQDHANIMWGLAALRLQPSAAWAAIAWDGSGAALEAAAAAAAAHAQRQQQPEEEEQQQLEGRQLQLQLRQQPEAPDDPPVAFLDERDAAHLAWAAARLQPPHQPGRAWLRRLWAASRPALPRYGAQAATMLLWSSARLGAAPPLPWTAAALAAVRSDLASLQPQGACQLLWALAALRQRPSSGFMRRMLERLQLELHLLPPAGFAHVLSALAALRYCPGATWWDSWWYCLRHDALARMAPGELAATLRGAAALGWPVPADALLALGAHAARVMPAAGLGEQGAIIHRLARLGWRPDGGGGAGGDEAERLLAACAAALRRDGAAAPGEAAQLLRGVARLGLAPGAAWLEAAEAALAGGGGDALAPYRAAQALAALSDLGAAPGQACADALLSSLLPERAAAGPQPAAPLPPALLDAAAAALAGWPHLRLSEPQVRGLLAARVASRAAAAAVADGGEDDPIDGLAAWESLVARCF
jgi:hypothetical protein